MIGMLNGASTIENSMEVPLKFKDTMWPSNSNSKYTYKKLKIWIAKSIITYMVIAVSFIIAKIWKQFKCP